MCYVDHNASGDKHAACAAKCIKSGGPVGIVSDGKAYLVVGDHKPMNDQLAEYAGKTITLKGKLAERGGCRCSRTPRSLNSQRSVFTTGAQCDREPYLRASLRTGCRGVSVKRR